MIGFAALWWAALPQAACAQAPVQTPAQAAYLKGEIRKAQEIFVARLSAISGVSRAKILEWAPSDGLDVPLKVKPVTALERARGRPLSDEQRQQVLAADQDRYEAIERAKRQALQR